MRSQKEGTRSGIEASGPPGTDEGEGRPAPAGTSRCTASGPEHAGKTERHWGPGNILQGKGRETQQKVTPRGAAPGAPALLLVRPSHSLVCKNTSDRTPAHSVVRACGLRAGTGAGLTAPHRADSSKPCHRGQSGRHREARQEGHVGTAGACGRQDILFPKLQLPGLYPQLPQE